MGEAWAVFWRMCLFALIVCLSIEWGVEVPLPEVVETVWWHVLYFGAAIAGVVVAKGIWNLHERVPAAILFGWSVVVAVGQAIFLLIEERGELSGVRLGYVGLGALVLIVVGAVVSFVAADWVSRLSADRKLGAASNPIVS